MRLLAIDFGTSNTAAMVYTSDQRVRPLLFDGSPLLPSAAYLTPQGRLLVGRDAVRTARLDPSRYEPNPKRRIDDGVLLLGDAEVPVPRLVAAVLAHVFTEARRVLGAAPEQVRLTHPEGWGQQRRTVLHDAVRLAGLPQVRLVTEPVAAASYYTAVLSTALPTGATLAIYDLGGGTFDAAVVRRTPGGFDVLAAGGLPDVGGLDFDHAIVEHLGRMYAPLDPAGWGRLRQPADSADRRDRQLLYDDVRGAKEMLSRTASTDVHLAPLRRDAHLTRDELETLVRPYLDRTVWCLCQAIGAAGLAPQQLAGIFLVGGSSRIPLAARLIHTATGVAPTTLEQPETVVVEGALYLQRSRASAPVSGLMRVVPVSPGPAGPRRRAPVAGVPPNPAGPRAAQPAIAAPPMRAAPGLPVPSGVAVPPGERGWYQEPMVLGTIIVLVLVVIAFVVLLALAA